MRNFEKFLREFLETSGITILDLLLIIVFGYILSKLIIIMIKRILLISSLDNSIVGFILSITRALFYSVMIVLVLLRLSVSISSIIALVSAFTLAISLSLQDTLANVANGLVLAFTKPFLVGDYVIIDTIEGKIQEIKMMNTVLLSFDNKKIILPNRRVFNAEITNFSSNKYRRVDLEIHVSYRSDVESVKNILIAVCKNHPAIEQKNDQLIRLLRTDSSSIVFVIKVWTATKNYWKVFYDLQETIFLKLKEHNIEIPYNQLDVHISQKEEQHVDIQ